MGLDVSGAESLAYDLQCTSDEYRSHDPSLAEEISSKAHEICREFGIDPTILDRSVTKSQRSEGDDEADGAQEPIDDDQTPYRNETSDTQLQGILDRQRDLLMVGHLVSIREM